MTDTIDARGSDAEPPKKKGFDLSIFLKHVAEVDTPIGKLYLFPLRDSDIRTFKALSATDAVERIRAFLPCIASLSPDYALKQERVGITADQASNLSGQTLESIAEAYALSNGLRFAREAEKEREPVVRATDEPATTFLDRLLRNEADEQANQFKKLKEQVLGSTHGIFDQVRKASQTLGDTRQQFERLTRASAFPGAVSPSIETKSLEFSNHMAEHSARLARERSEDREMVRLTGQMTAQSAETLQELAGAASTMLEQLDRRDDEAKQTTKVQLWIAVGSVIVSALLALVALVVSVAAYYQDKENISSGDKWQASVLGELKAANQQASQAEASNRTLLQTVEQLRAKVSDLESRPPQAPTSTTKPHR
jgi:cell division protein FtsB